MTLENFLKSSPQVLSMKADAAQKFKACLKSKTPVLIGISGETACGKSMLLNLLLGVVKSGAVIDGDNYFKDISDKIRQAGSFANLCNQGYDLEAPDSFNLSLMYDDLSALKQGQTVYIPRYHLDGTGVVIERAQKVIPAHFIFVGGISAFFEPVRTLLDFRIYIETDFNERQARFMKRAIEERSMTPNEAELQFNRVNLRAKKYLLPLKTYADFVIKGDGEVSKQRDFVKTLMNFEYCDEN